VENSLKKAAESPASGARFGGHGLEDPPTLVVNRHAHNKPSFVIQARQTPNTKTNLLRKLASHEAQRKAETICPEPKP
jgi:hypothetical protein